MNNFTTLNKIKKNIAKIIYVKNFAWKQSNDFIYSIIYNFFILSIAIIGIVPIIFNLINAKFNNAKSLNGFYLASIIFCVIYLIDYLLRILTVDIYYETNYKKALKRQIFSIASNYQFLSSLCIILLIICFISKNNSYLTFNKKIFSNDIALVTFSTLFLVNFISIFPRFIAHRTNLDNIKSAKHIIYSKRKSILITFLVMIFVWLLFSYAIFIVERDANSNINDVADAMYFTFISMTTVGLGDIVPTTSAGKILSILSALFGVCFYGYVGSIFVNIYIEYINKKKQIRQEIIQQKYQENLQKKLLIEMNELFLKNLYMAGIISKGKYEKLIKLNNQDKKNKKIIYHLNDFELDQKNKKIYFNHEIIGNKNYDKKTIDEAWNKKWLALRSKPDEIEAVLCNFPFKFIEKIKKAENMPIIFSSKFIDDNIEKIIVFTKQSLKAAIFEINLISSITLEKENAWKIYGGFTNMSKNKFDSLFKKIDKVNVLLVKDIIFYEKIKPLEAFGVNPNLKIENVIYLKY